MRRLLIRTDLFVRRCDGGHAPPTATDLALIVAAGTSLHRILRPADTRNGSGDVAPRAEDAAWLVALGLLVRERWRAERWENN